MAKLLLDSTVLILRIIGAARRDLIGERKHVREFDADDYDRLVEICNRYTEHVTTPHVLAETSNLVGGKPGDPLRTTFLAHLAAFASAAEERNVDADLVVAHRHFKRLGFADIGILLSAQPKTCILTTDLALYLEALNARLDAINFNNIRAADG